MFRLLIVMCLTILFGCSGQYNTLRQPNGDFIMYTLSEPRAYRIVESEVSSITGSVISEIGGHVRGFEIDTTFLLDHYNAIIKIVPIDGITPTNDTIRGVFIEMKGSGTYPSKSAKRAYDNILQRLKETNTEIRITSYKRVKFITRDDNTIISKLLKLKLLHEEGIINDDEYFKKNAELVEQL